MCQRLARLASEHVSAAGPLDIRLPLKLRDAQVVRYFDFALPSTCIRSSRPPAWRGLAALETLRRLSHWPLSSSTPLIGSPATICSIA